MSKKHNNGTNIKQYFLSANSFANFIFGSQFLILKVPKGLAMPITLVGQVCLCRLTKRYA
jgi:hypothetical protein